MRLSDNTILFAGGTSGIGRALAEQLYLRGNHVIIAGRRQALLESITTAHPGMHGIQLDLADPRSIEACVVRVKDQVPSLNVVANIAAISHREDLANDPHVIARSIIETNVVGVLHLTLALLPLLLKQPHATVLATTSGSAFVPNASYRSSRSSTREGCRRRDAPARRVHQRNHRRRSPRVALGRTDRALRRAIREAQ